MLGQERERYNEVIKKANEILNNFQYHINENNVENALPIDNLQTQSIIPKEGDIKSNSLRIETRNEIIPSINLKPIDVVIGMAQKTDPKNLAVFCGSLRK